MGKWIKKLAGETPLTVVAKVIDSLNVTTNNRTNAPSIRAVNDAIANKWETIYPIGSVYISVSSEFDPSIAFGGTWQRVKDRFLLASGDTYSSGATGGSATNTLTTAQLPSHTHTYNNATQAASHALTVEEMPSHRHSYGYIANNAADLLYTSGSTRLKDNIYNLNGEQTGYTSYSGSGQGHTHNITSSSTNSGSVGSGASINNMPPYLAVNVWVRTA